MTKSRVDYDELAHLATQVRRAQSSLDAGVQGFSAAPGPPASAFGNTTAGAACQSALRQAQPKMGAVLKAFANTIDSDAERLELALALYRKTDAEAADNMLAANRNRLDVFSTQLSTGSHPWAQGNQIDKLRGLAGDPSQGNAIVAGDFNAVASGNGRSAQGIRDFGGQGFDVNAGDIHDGKGGTSASHLPIDYVMPRGVGASDTQRWDRKQSDHDGQVVDVTMPNW